MNPSTGQLHPWNEDRKYLSQFPINFRGCFICSETDHRGSRDCQLAKDGKFDKNYSLRNCRHINHIPNAFIYLKMVVKILQLLRMTSNKSTTRTTRKINTTRTTRTTRITSNPSIYGIRRVTMVPTLIIIAIILIITTRITRTTRTT